MGLPTYGSGHGHYLGYDVRCFLVYPYYAVGWNSIVWYLCGLDDLYGLRLGHDALLYGCGRIPQQVGCGPVRAATMVAIGLAFTLSICFTFVPTLSTLWHFFAFKFLFTTAPVSFSDMKTEVAVDVAAQTVA